MAVIRPANDSLFMFGLPTEAGIKWAIGYYPIMRLLLVEDEPEIQGFLECSLIEAGYQVEVAANGAIAEQLGIEGEHDALIVDLGVPDIDGITLILRLRQLGVATQVSQLKSCQICLGKGLKELSRKVMVWV